MVFKLTLTHEYEANPSGYFTKAPEKVTQGVLDEMIAIDTSNMDDLLDNIIESGDYSVTIEAK